MAPAATSSPSVTPEALYKSALDCASVPPCGETGSSGGASCGASGGAPFGALEALTRDFMNLELQRIWQIQHNTVLFITHSISEAVFLSDRVLVMSARPGKVIADITIDLPEERTAETRQDPKFFDYVSAIRGYLVDAYNTAKE
mgnify:CR=1 FL=1